MCIIDLPYDIIYIYMIYDVIYLYLFGLASTFSTFLPKSLKSSSRKLPESAATMTRTPSSQSRHRRANQTKGPERLMSLASSPMASKALRQRTRPAA